MKKKLCFFLFIVSSICHVLASEYIFEGIKYIYDIDTHFCFNNGNFEILTYNENGVWQTKSFPYILSKEGAYLVANVKKGNKTDKIFIFNADRNHLIFFDCDENQIYDTTEKKGHRDESWILSCIGYEASSYLSEELNGKRIDYLPENLAVNNLTSSWVEGVPGYGKNEKITFHNRPLNGSRRLYIINGFFSPSKPSLFYDNNRIKTLKINCYKDDVLVDFFERVLEDTGEMQFIEFSERYSSFDFIIQDVYEGRKYNDTALTGIFVDALDVYEE